MAKCALVSTTDSIEGIPSHCVWLFETQEEAYSFAARMIVENDRSVSYDESIDQWSIDDETFDEASEFLDAWQEGLDATEFFHVMEVQDVPVSVGSKEESA